MTNVSKQLKRSRASESTLRDQLRKLEELFERAKSVMRDRGIDADALLPYDNVILNTPRPDQSGNSTRRGDSKVPTATSAADEVARATATKKTTKIPAAPAPPLSKAPATTSAPPIPTVSSAKKRALSVSSSSPPPSTKYSKKSGGLVRRRPAGMNSDDESDEKSGESDDILEIVNREVTRIREGAPARAREEPAPAMTTTPTPPTSATTATPTAPRPAPQARPSRYADRPDTVPVYPPRNPYRPPPGANYTRPGWKIEPSHLGYEQVVGEILDDGTEREIVGAPIKDCGYHPGKKEQWDRRSRRK